MTAAVSGPPQFSAYVRLFNEGEFFEAHEVLEALWWERDCDPFWQGFIIFAAAFEKVRRGEPGGARKHFQATVRYLETFVPGRDGIDVRPVVAHARRCLALLDAGERPDRLPRFAMPPGEIPTGDPPREASDEEIRRVAEAALAGEQTLPSVTKEVMLRVTREVMLRMQGRAGRSRVKPVVCALLEGR